MVFSMKYLSRLFLTSSFPFDHDSTTILLSFRLGFSSTFCINSAVCLFRLAILNTNTIKRPSPSPKSMGVIWFNTNLDTSCILLGQQEGAGEEEERQGERRETSNAIRCPRARGKVFGKESELSGDNVSDPVPNKRCCSVLISILIGCTLAYITGKQIQIHLQVQIQIQRANCNGGGKRYLASCPKSFTLGRLVALSYNWI